MSISVFLSVILSVYQYLVVPILATILYRQIKCQNQSSFLMFTSNLKCNYFPLPLYTFTTFTFVHFVQI